MGLWFWLGLADDVIRYDTLDRVIGISGLGAHPLVEYAHQYASASAIEWSAKWANSGGDLAAALCAWRD